MPERETRWALTVGRFLTPIAISDHLVCKSSVWHMQCNFDLALPVSPWSLRRFSLDNMCLYLLGTQSCDGVTQIL